MEFFLVRSACKIALEIQGFDVGGSVSDDVTPQLYIYIYKRKRDQIF